jgi:hypothetical protein
MTLFFGGRAERFVGDELVGREAIVQLDDVDVLDPGVRLLQRAVRLGG